MPIHDHAMQEKKSSRGGGVTGDVPTGCHAGHAVSVSCHGWLDFFVFPLMSLSVAAGSVNEKMKVIFYKPRKNNAQYAAKTNFRESD